MSPTKLGSGRFLFGLNRENEEFVRHIKNCSPGCNASLAKAHQNKQKVECSTRTKPTKQDSLSKTWDAISLPR